MPQLLSPYAFVDFRCPGELKDVAHKVSQHLFGGIEFVGENTGIWDEVPAVRLRARILGMEIELGGCNGEYILQIDTVGVPWAEIPTEEHPKSHADLSGYVAYLLEQLDGVEMLPPVT
jgi:hypothetical protein